MRKIFIYFTYVADMILSKMMYALPRHIAIAPDGVLNLVDNIMNSIRYEFESLKEHKTKGHIDSNELLHK